MAKVYWFNNAVMKIDGGRLHIEVELDESKIEASGQGYLASRLQRFEDTPAGPVSVNVSVRKLKPGEIRNR